MKFQLLFFYTETLKDFKMQIQIFWSTLVFSYFVTAGASHGWVQQEPHKSRQYLLRQAFILNRVQLHHTN